jgi:hypothetical protein
MGKGLLYPELGVTFTAFLKDVCGVYDADRVGTNLGFARLPLKCNVILVSRWKNQNAPQAQGSRAA